METEENGTLTHSDIIAADLPDWRLLLQTLHGRFATTDFVSAFRLVERITEVAEEANHHPDVELGWGMVGVRLTSHDTGGVTLRDVRLARRISALAAELGATPRPTDAAVVEVALDTADLSRISAFWRALLRAEDGAADDEVVDPSGQVPTLWFQDTEEHPLPRQRFHLDIWVPADVAEQRVAEALAVGGTLVSDEAAPRFWVLADADGNKACVCTSADRPAPTG